MLYRTCEALQAEVEDITNDTIKHIKQLDIYSDTFCYRVIPILQHKTVIYENLGHENCVFITFYVLFFCIKAHLLLINSLESLQTFVCCVFPSLKDELMYDFRHLHGHEIHITESRMSPFPLQKVST